jgi:hypothetical protein
MRFFSFLSNSDFLNSSTQTKIESKKNLFCVNLFFVFGSIKDSKLELKSNLSSFEILNFTIFVSSFSSHLGTTIFLIFGLWTNKALSHQIH